MNAGWALALIAAALAVAQTADAAGPEARVLPTEEVPFVGTPPVVVDKMLELAGVRATDFVIDLGSGDGRILIAAAKQYGARGLGVDIDTFLLKEAEEKAIEAGVADRVAFRRGDLFETDLQPATVVALYLLPEYLAALRAKLLAELRPGARIVSHDYDMGDWPPDARANVPVPDKPVGIEKSSDVFLWIVPARVAGTWRFVLPDGREAELEIVQRYGALSGTMRVDGRALPVERGAVRGEAITFRVDGGGDAMRFEGSASTDRIAGQMIVGGKRHSFRAIRAASP